MTKNNAPIIKAAEAQLYLNDAATVVIDARSGADAYHRYQSAHLQGALHVDLDKDLSEKPADPAAGGRHPLPDIKKFTTLLGNLGITPATRVIIYDDKNGANAAARFWWMLKAVGHEQAYVVDGGLNSMQQQGLPFSDSPSPSHQKSAYPANTWQRSTASIDVVAKAVTDPDFLVIDVREGYRYRGESEPIDLTPGHIPGAINIPYIQNLDKNGNFLAADALAAQYKEALGKRAPGNVIIHCGSGVTACHTLLALEQAGITGAGLYVGSWSEWSRTGRPVARANN
jgi:thiosulfate/3-mercaptopyruvate sulfurtransferase